MSQDVERHLSNVAADVANRVAFHQESLILGSIEEFRANWQRPETKYCHFTRDAPVNQIQFAFRQNWLEFDKIMEPLKPWQGKRCLEVGAGRGTMSMYFADNGFKCTLLDACEEPLNQAKEAFTEHNLHARYVLGDALELPLADESFDVVFSYGLLEHFEDDGIGKVIDEQIRVLKPGGVLISYVVPLAPNECNRRWKLMSDVLGGHLNDKSPVYRNRLLQLHYEREFESLGLESVTGHGVYNFPIISPSPDFPFTLNSPEVEQLIVNKFCSANGFWSCPRDFGQAFIVWGWKR